MTNQRVVHTRVPAIVILLFALAALLPDAFSQEELTPPGSPATAEADAGGGMPPANEVDRDFLFASGLIEIGFPDFADKVVEKVLLTRPELKDRAKLIQAEIMIKRRKFTDAEALVKEMGAANPKAQAISLALANGYYQMGETEKAKGLYNEFFRVYEGRAPTDPDLLRFYQDAAYRFGQMLEAAGDYEGAIKAYGRILTTKVDRDAQRRIQSDQAAMYMRLAAKAPGDQRERYLGEAKKLCETIQWGGMDIWFGQSIITMANISLLRGDKTGATKVLQSNMDILKEIDKFMQEAGMPMSISPMAGARFLLGDLLQQQADAIAGSKEKTEEAIQTYARALTEFYNVFAKYGDSDWGPEAGVRAQAIKSKLEREYGKKINIDLGAFQAKAAATQFKLGDNLFRQRQYQAAIDEYLKNLNQFPEGDISAAALANLLQCYANLNDTLSVKMVTEYLGERFSQNPQAALALLALGKYYFDTNDVPMYTYAYESYLHYFPKHEKAGLILFTLAGLSKKSGDEAAAMDYYRRIVENYKQDQYYLKALSQMGWSLYAAKDYAGAIKGFQVYLAEAQPSQLKAQAQFSLADCYLQTGDFKNALEAFKTLVGWLSVSNNPYAVNTAEVQKNDELAEKSLFQLGFCLARLADPKDAIPAYRASAIKVFDSFIAKYPQSPLAAKAYSYKGTVQLELNQADAAAKTFDELAAKYPQTEEGKSALYALVRSALEIKQ